MFTHAGCMAMYQAPSLHKECLSTLTVMADIQIQCVRYVFGARAFEHSDVRYHCKQCKQRDVINDSKGHSAGDLPVVGYCLLHVLWTTFLPLMYLV